MKAFEEQFITQITPIFSMLEKNLISFLEEDGEEAQRQEIKQLLQQFQDLFKKHNFRIATRCCELVQELIDKIEPYGESENEDFVLRFCLIIGRLLEDAEYETTPKDQFFAHYLQSLQEYLSITDHQQTQHTFQVNFQLLKVLRTLFQQQLLQLIKVNHTPDTLAALVAASQEIEQSLPNTLHYHYQGIILCLNAVTQGHFDITPTLYRLLGAMDHYLSRYIRQETDMSSMLPELKSMLEQFPEGEQWLSENIAGISHQMMITAATMARFVNVAKPSLIALHEALEKNYLEKTNISEDSLIFIADLANILHLMRYPRLAELTHQLKHSLEQFNLHKTTESIDSAICCLWVLEAFVYRLWKIEDRTVPLTPGEISTWNHRTAQKHLAVVIAESYAHLRQDLENEKGSDFPHSICQKLLNLLQLQRLSGLKSELDINFQKAIEAGLTSRNTYTTVITALEYWAQRQAEDGNISPILLANAKQLLQDYLSTQSPIAITPTAVENITETLHPETAIDEHTLNTEDVLSMQDHFAAEVSELPLPSFEEAVYEETDTPPIEEIPIHLPVAVFEEEAQPIIVTTNHAINNEIAHDDFSTSLSTQTAEISDPSSSPNSYQSNEHLQQIISRIDTTCAGWEAIGDAGICRPALAAVLFELQQIALLENRHEVAKLASTWHFWLDFPSSPVQLKDTPQLKTAVQQMILHLEKDINAENLTPYFRFLKESFGEIVEEELTNESDGSSLSEEETLLPSLLLDVSILEVLKTETAELYQSTQQVFMSNEFTPQHLLTLQRIAHTIKGNANLVKLQETAALAQKLEHKIEKVPEPTLSLRAELQQKFDIIYRQLFEKIKYFNQLQTENTQPNAITMETVSSPPHNDTTVMPSTDDNSASIQHNDTIVDELPATTAAQQHSISHKTHEASTTTRIIPTHRDKGVDGEGI